VKTGMRRIHSFLASLFLIALVLGPFSILPSSVFANASSNSATQSTTAAGATSTPQSQVYPQALSISNSAASAIVIETNRGRHLYEKKSNTRLVLPAVNKIMTALIAAEKLPLETKVTISKIAATAGASESTADRITLKTGDKYTLEYLMLRLLFYDSDAAAIAIAEQISNVEPEFVKIMNARATTFGMTNTLFANSSGEVVVRTETTNGAEIAENLRMASIQYTTVEDLAILMQTALLNDKFSRLFRKQSEYIVLDGKTLVPMVNQISSLWPYSEGRVSGAFLSEFGVSTCIAVGMINGFNIISITAEGDHNQVVNDVLALFNACEQTYENTPLVQIGSIFSGGQEKTLDGEVFGLEYQKTVNYVHPKGDTYLKSTVRYTSFGPYSRPIQRSMTVGQVIFELVDGTRIAVDVGPDRQILSSINLVDKALSTLQSNRNLNFFILASILLLFIVMVIRLVGILFRLINRLRQKADGADR
jgi:D-alanyl-D-alanine carboxypeptidase (penicillin-binding protein 5/6)